MKLYWTEPAGGWIGHWLQLSAVCLSAWLWKPRTLLPM